MRRVLAAFTVLLAVGLGAGLDIGLSRDSGGATGTGSTRCPPGKTVRIPAPGRMGSLGRGSWSWFADPRAVRLSSPYRETVSGWVDWRGGVTVAALDPACSTETTHVVGRMFHDDHGAPAFVVEPDRRLTVFWSAHNGRKMYYRTTLRPGDVSAWGHEHEVRSRLRGGLGFTYPNPVMLPKEGNRLYLFWRGADWSADYATRGVDGRWGAAHELIRNPGQRPYVKVSSDGSDTIALAFTNGHPRETRTSIYYAACGSGWLRHADGRRIARLGAGPIRPAQADVVYDGSRSGVSAWVWDVAVDAGGRPVIVYATFPSTRDHVYWYARWTGQGWSSHRLTTGGPTISPGTIEGQYSGGLVLDHENPSILWVSRKLRGSFALEKWWTSDGGAHWRHVTVIRTRGGNVRPVVPRGPQDGQPQVLWLHGRYRSYSEYRTTVDYMR
jgi:hypothetical protein